MRPRTLCFDIGASGIKVRVFDSRGNPISDRIKVKTPHRMKPAQAMRILAALRNEMPAFDRVSAGFPGVVKEGRTWTATNLGPGWKGFDLREALAHELRAPVRVANDADVQGLGSIQGKGVELLLTLGTGLGSALFHQGVLIPNLELHGHPLEKGKTYEDLLGKKAIARLGERRWNHKIRVAIAMLSKVFNWDYLYLGGGESRRITEPLPERVRVVSNENGLLGGVKLWKRAGAPLERDEPLEAAA